MLTVSIRNGNSVDKLKEHGFKLNSTSSGTPSPKSPVERTFFRENSTNSNTDLMTLPKRPRRRRRRTTCLLPMVVMTIVILGGLLATVGVVLLNPTEGSQGTFFVHVSMAIINYKYQFYNMSILLQ